MIFIIIVNSLGFEFVSLNWACNPAHFQDLNEFPMG